MCDLLQYYRDGHADAEQEVWDVQEYVSRRVFISVVQEQQ